MREFRLQLPSDHQFDQPLAGQRGHRLGGDVFTVTHYRGAVADRENLIKPVAHVDDSKPLAAQVANDGEQLLHLAAAQRSGRFVHDEDAGVLRERLGDFNELLLRNGERTTGRFRIDVRVESAEKSSRRIVFVTLRDEAGACRFAAQENVLARTERWDKIELLVNDGDARARRIVRRRHAELCPIDTNPSGIRAMRAGEHLDERAFARAVFAEQRVHFAAAQVELAAGDGPHAGKRFLDSLHFKQRRHRRTGDLFILEDMLCNSFSNGARSSIREVMLCPPKGRATEFFRAGNLWALPGRSLRLLLFHFSLASRDGATMEVAQHQRLAPGRIIRTSPSTGFNS